MLEAKIAIESFELKESIFSLGGDKKLKNILYELSPKINPEINDFIENNIIEEEE